MADPKCPKCGAVMQHYCGMACVDMCPVCDFGHTPEPTPGGGEREAIAAERADWLLDAVACATQNRQFLRGEKEYDQVAGEAILLNGKKAIEVALGQAARLAPVVTLTSEESEQVALTRKYIISLRFDGDHIRALLAIIDRVCK